MRRIVHWGLLLLYCTLIMLINSTLILSSCCSYHRRHSTDSRRIIWTETKYIYETWHKHKEGGHSARWSLISTICGWVPISTPSNPSSPLPSLSRSALHCEMALEVLLSAASALRISLAAARLDIVSLGSLAGDRQSPSANVCALQHITPIVPAIQRNKIGNNQTHHNSKIPAESVSEISSRSQHNRHVSHFTVTSYWTQTGNQGRLSSIHSGMKT